MKRILGAVGVFCLMGLCFSTASPDRATQSPQPRVESPNACGAEGDTCPMPWPPIGKMQWDKLPTGHEGK